MPEAFYRDWFKVAAEEARHFSLLSARLAQFGHRYGDFPAHDGLWEMAERTRGDVLARMALVPRVDRIVGGAGRRCGNDRSRSEGNETEKRSRHSHVPLIAARP